MRLIDADALPAALFQHHVHDGEELEPMLYYDDAIQVVNDASTVNAVSVVRCKNCRFCCSVLRADVMMCYLWMGWITPDDYCSKGERRDEHETDRRG